MKEAEENLFNRNSLSTIIAPAKYFCKGKKVMKLRFQAHHLIVKRGQEQ